VTTREKEKGVRRRRGAVAHRMHIYFYIFVFITESSEKHSVAPFGVPRFFSLKDLRQEIFDK
jgi:hypothetical protein